MKHPDCIIIYVPGDNQAHMVSAQQQRHDRGWLYSQWVILPEDQMNDFIKERLEDNFIIIDERVKADDHTSGMSAATPIFAIRKDVNPVAALAALIQLHQAIVDNQMGSDDETPT